MAEQIEGISKMLLGVTGKYYVAAELGRRNIDARLTFTTPKRPELSISYGTQEDLKVEVRCKQGGTWPQCKGINSENSVLVLVDFENIDLTARPTFYFLDRNDWSEIMTLKDREYRAKYPTRQTKIEDNVIKRQGRTVFRVVN